MDIVEKAEQYARRAHTEQFLNTTRNLLPFITHPEKVAALVASCGGTPQEIAAAWLHDVAEDTPVTVDDIRKEFGEAIGDMVDGLTDPPHFAGEITRIRKAMQAERIVSKSDSVKKIKIADQTVNITLMGEDPPKNWSAQKRLEYVEGAKGIIDNCRGLNAALEEAFDSAYEKTTAQIARDAGALAIE